MKIKISECKYSLIINDQFPADGAYEVFEPLPPSFLVLFVKFAEFLGIDCPLDGTDDDCAASRYDSLSTSFRIHYLSKSSLYEEIL